MVNWISVEDSLPSENLKKCAVFVRNESGDTFCTTLVFHACCNGGSWKQIRNYDLITDILCWTPLPELKDIE